MNGAAERRRDHRALTVSQLASGAGSLLLLLVTARVLGPEGRGEFSFFLLWPMLGSYLLSLGIPGANLRLVAADGARAPGLAGNTLALTGVIAIATAIPLALGPPGWLVGPMSTELAWLAWGSTAVMTLFQGLTWLQMGLGRFVTASVLRGAFPAAAAVIFVGLAAAGGGRLETPEAAAAAFMTSVIVVTAAVAVGLARATGRPRLDRALFPESLSFAVRYQGGLVAQLVTYRADQWVLGLTQSAATLGVYSVAVSVSEVATYGPSAKGMTRFKDSAAQVNDPVRGTVVWVAAATAVGAVVVGLSALLIPLVFGEDFDDAVWLTLLLVPGTLGVGLMRVCGNDLAGRGRPEIISAIAVVQSVLMVAAFVVFIPQHGSAAAAVISSIGYLLGGAVTVWALRRVARDAPGAPTPGREGAPAA